MSVKESSAMDARRESSSRLVDGPSSLPYLAALCMLLIFGVLAFGAVETWATSILEIGSALLFAADCRAPDRFFWRSGEVESSLSSNGWVRGGCSVFN